MPNRVTLMPPSRDLLDAYAAALRAGWSPNTMHDVSAEQLAAIAADPDDFIRGLSEEGRPLRLPDGSEVLRIPGFTRWIFADGGGGPVFVGAINLRWTQDAAGRPLTALPEHVLGHLGYTILPGFEGRGHATAALAALLVEARQLGLPHVEITCDAGNGASHRVIEKNGGRLVERLVSERYGPEPRLRFVVDL